MSDGRLPLGFVSSGAAVVVLVWGLYVLLTGRFRFPGGISVEGRRARTAGLFLITPLVSAYLIPGLLSDARGSILLGTPVKFLALLGGISGGAIYARMNSGEALSPTAARIGKVMLTLSVLVFAVPAHAALASVLRGFVANHRPVPASITLLLLAGGWFLIFRTVVAFAELSRGKATVVGSTMAVLFVAFHAWVVLGTPRAGIDPAIAEALAGVCSGQGVQGAAEYTGGRGPHTTVVLGPSGGLYESPRGLGPGWNPSSVADTELVLCVSEETAETPLCPDGSRLVDIAGREAELFEARTGRLVHRFLDLTVPFQCSTEQELSEDLTNLSGLGSVLEGYLNASE